MQTMTRQECGYDPEEFPRAGKNQSGFLFKECHQKMTQGNFTGVEIELHILINCGCSIPLNVQDQVGQGLKQSGLEEDVPADGRGGMG